MPTHCRNCQTKVIEDLGKIYIPSYELISDKDGNQIYVEQSVDENRLTSEDYGEAGPQQY